MFQELQSGYEDEDSDSWQMNGDNTPDDIPDSIFHKDPDTSPQQQPMMNRTSSRQQRKDDQTSPKQRHHQSNHERSPEITINMPDGHYVDGDIRLKNDTRVVCVDSDSALGSEDHIDNMQKCPIEDKMSEIDLDVGQEDSEMDMEDFADKYYNVHVRDMSGSSPMARMLGRRNSTGVSNYNCYLTWYILDLI